MKEIRELLRRRFDEGLSQRDLARSLGVVRSTVERALARFAASGLSWPLEPSISDEVLELRLYGGPAQTGYAKDCERPNWPDVVRELGRKGVTRRLLWSEYRDRVPEGIGYSVFCDELAQFQADRDVVYRHDQIPGERAYFDFAGMTLRYRNGETLCSARIFVAALGYSNALFAHAYADETASSWLDGQRRAFVAFGGVPRIGVPDNPRALVAGPDRYEPQLTQVYRDFAEHYGITIIPARVRKPRDKGAVECGVKIIEMRILAAARDWVFDSLSALNAWLQQEVACFNAQPFQKRVGSRLGLLEHERLALLPLPTTGFEAATYLKRKVARDYHVDVHRQYYSVPYQHAGQTVEVRLTLQHVEILRGSQRLALHRRAPTSQRFVTDPAHMPDHHQAFADPQIERRAEAIGEPTAQLIAALFGRRRHPEQALRSAQGILALARDHGPAALNTACQRALALEQIGYHAVKRLISYAEQQVPLPLPPVTHEHVRGSAYYSEEVRHVA